ncbi:C10 family peptidase [Dysgonomonas sp. ZJ709]|uniref:C10 family peptidase n=1 Tax=Dysgonomonas sp. ZJ709 TaxID=2709797 RepID=UPI0013EDAB07|nr:C10 family peptidase [Dysgonomonas sp. ZJ709]
MKKIAVITFLLILVFSCNNESISDLANEKELLGLEENQTSFELNESEAQSVLLSFIDARSNSLKSNSNNIKIRGIKKKYYRLEGNTNSSLKSTKALHEIPLYNFFLEDSDNNNGYAIVSGDIRIPVVLSLSNIGSLSDTIYNKALAEWYNVHLNEYICQKLIQFENATDSVLIRADWKSTKMADKQTPMKEGWLKLGTTIWNESPTFTCYAYDTQIEYRKIFDSGVILKVEWDQNSPYNGSLPLINCNGSNINPYTGCTVTAMSQIMTHHQKPNTYNWTLLKSKPTISYLDPNTQLINEVRRLMKDMGSKVKIQYKCGGSSSNIDNVLSALKSMGYSGTIVGASHNDYDTYRMVEEEIKNNRPIYYRGTESGEGHAWVIDGYQDFIVNYYGQLKAFDKQTGNVILDNPWQMIMGNNFMHSKIYHVNFGWGGSSNGWYVYPDGGSQFNSDQKIIIGIK